MSSSGMPLANVFWIGGSSCAGKSTIAGKLAHKYNLYLYSCDDHFDAHLRLATPDRYPAMRQISAMSPNEAFYERTLAEQLSCYIQSFKEGFDWILKDIESLPQNKPVIVEGNNLLPELVSGVLSKNNHAIWIVPTEPFQRLYYARRDWVNGILEQTENPDMSFDNWMKRDALFANRVESSAINLNLKLLKADGKKSIEENMEIIEKHFRFIR